MTPAQAREIAALCKASRLRGLTCHAETIRIGLREQSFLDEELGDAWAAAEAIALYAESIGRADDAEKAKAIADALAEYAEVES